MGDQPSSSHFVSLFEAALQDYERQTGKKLADHPLLEQLQNCDSVDSVIAVLQQQAQAFSEFRGSDKIMRSLKATVSILCKLSTFADLGEAVTLVCRKVPMGILRLSDTYPTVIPTRECNTSWLCHPACCMCLPSILLCVSS